MEQDPTTHPKYTWTNQKLRRAGKLVISNSTTLKETVLKWLHGSSIGGHFGRDVTLYRVKSLFFGREWIRTFSHISEDVMFSKDVKAKM